MSDASALIRRSFFLLALAPLLLMVGGCALLGGSPSAANIALRKQVQTLNGQITSLKQQVSGQDEVIKGLRERSGTLPTLPPDRLSNLWTTHGLKFGRLTGGWDRDLKAEGDEGIKVYVAPTDEDGQAIKMAGSFTIELFDLADTSQPSIGTWKFDVVAARKAWRGMLMDYNYVLECPWQNRVPTHPELTLKVTFVDELTQTPFHAQQVITVKVPTGTTRPATQPRPSR